MKPRSHKNHQSYNTRYRIQFIYVLYLDYLFYLSLLMIDNNDNGLLLMIGLLNGARGIYRCSCIVYIYISNSFKLIYRSFDIFDCRQLYRTSGPHQYSALNKKLFEKLTNRRCLAVDVGPSCSCNTKL